MKNDGVGHKKLLVTRDYKGSRKICGWVQCLSMI